MYRLKSDLEFGELLPEKPGLLEQEEYEERTAAGSTLAGLRSGLRSEVYEVWDLERH